jgi:predicted CoA-binding protein
MDWKKNIIVDRAEVAEVLRTARRIAVLGIKPETHAGQPAHDVAAYLKRHGYTIIPVPVYYPEVTQILDAPVYRTVSAIPASVDVVDVFRRPADIDQHVDDLIAARPKYVWFQLGIRNDAAAERLARAGIKVIQDRCMLADHAAMGIGAVT